MNLYLIVFNNLQGFDEGEIHHFIKSLPNTPDWWHYLPSVYIVSTFSSAKGLADRMRDNFKGLSFLIVKLDLNDYNGILPMDAWQWIGKKKNQKIKLKLSTLPPISTTPKPSSLMDIFAPKNPQPITLPDIMDYISGKKK